MVQFWRNNWGYKLVALLLAILLWLWVPAKAGSSTDIVVPLQVKGVPSNLVVTSKIPNSVTVTVQGANSSELSASIDLSNAVKGKNNVPVTISGPAGAKNYIVDPDQISVDLDDLKEISVPIQVNLTGAVAEGYDKGKPIVRPSTVTIRGPETSLAQIDKVLVEVNLANATDTIQTSASVRIVDANGKPLAMPDPTRPLVVAQPQDVSIIIPVTKKDVSSKSVPVRLTTKGTPANGFVLGQVIATPDVVTIYGPGDKLKGIDELNGGTIDITGAAQDVVMDIRPENLGLPAGVTLEPGTNLEGIAHLVPSPVEQTLPAVPIAIRGLADGLTAVLSQNTVNMVLKGSADAVSSVKSSDKLLWIDVTGMTSGQQKEVQVYPDQLPPGVEAINLPKIIVTVK